MMTHANTVHSSCAEKAIIQGVDFFLRCQSSECSCLFWCFLFGLVAGPCTLLLERWSANKSGFVIQSVLCMSSMSWDLQDRCLLFANPSSLFAQLGRSCKGRRLEIWRNGPWAVNALQIRWLEGRWFLEYMKKWIYQIYDGLKMIQVGSCGGVGSYRIYKRIIENQYYNVDIDIW